MCVYSRRRMICGDQYTVYHWHWKEINNVHDRWPIQTNNAGCVFGNMSCSLGKIGKDIWHMNRPSITKYFHQKLWYNLCLEFLDKVAVCWLNTVEGNTIQGDSLCLLYSFYFHKLPLHEWKDNLLYCKMETSAWTKLK